MEKFSKTKHIAITVLFIFLFFAFGMYVGGSNYREMDKILGVSAKDPEVETQVDFSPFWKVWNTINEKYPKADKIADQNRVYGAISGLVDSLNDPYSVFFSPDEAKAFEEEIAGNFTGVGMEVGIKDKILTVIAPLKDTPAYGANIKPGDKILQIDDSVTSNLGIEKAIKLIGGEKGTTVILTIFREGEKE